VRRLADGVRRSGAALVLELGREPSLADARLSGDEDGRTAPRPRLVERVP